MITTAVVVCTRDRPDQLRRCIDSILANRPPGTRLFVVDQSTGPSGATVVDQLTPGDPDLVYLPSSRRGLSAARNEGLSRAGGYELVLFTDDDCEVEPGWVETWQRIFEGDRRRGVGFGRVGTPEVILRGGHIPHFSPPLPFLSAGLELFEHGVEAIGMGANMAVRYGACTESGGFDEVLGAGARFPAAEDLDIAYRILGSGYSLVQSAEAAVVHYGFRSDRAASSLGKGYALATGAMMAKHVRCGGRRAAAITIKELIHLAGNVVRAVIRGDRPTGLNSLLSFCRGFLLSWRCPVQRSRCLYVPETM